MFHPLVKLRPVLAVLAAVALALPSAAAAVDLGRPHHVGRGQPVKLLVRDGAYWLVWFRYDVGASGSLSVRELDPEGGPAGPVRRYAGGRTVAVNGDAALVAGVSELADAGWSGKVWVATLGADGSLGPRRVVADWTGVDLALEPWGDDGFALAFRDPSTSLHVRRLDLSGAPIGPPRLLLAMPPVDEGSPLGGNPEWFASFALAPRGDRVFAVWETEGKWDPRHSFFRGPFGRSLAADGGMGPVLRLSAGLGDDVPLGPVALELDGALVTAWTSPAGRVLVRRVDPVAGAVGPPIRVSARPRNHALALAADPVGGGLAVWQRDGRAGLRLLGRWLAGGEPTGAVFRIGRGGDPVVAIGPDGAGVVVWQSPAADGSWVLRSRRVSR